MSESNGCILSHINYISVELLTTKQTYPVDIPISLKSSSKVFYNLCCDLTPPFD